MKYTKISPNGVKEKNQFEWKKPKNDKWGKYVVDDSNFIPMSEQVKSVAKMPTYGNDTVEQIYDFPDGKDTGAKIPFARSRDGRGLVELSKFTQEESKKLNQKRSEAVQKATEESIKEAKIKALTE